MLVWRHVTRERIVEQQMKDTLASLVETAGSMRAAAEQLSGDSARTGSIVQAAREHSREIEDGSNSISAATEEMSITVSNIAASTRDLADSADRAVTATSAAKAVVDTLVAANEKIARVTETIATIADQTNLLALNATIEAAGAGDAGRGFSVVASEVKDLARETMNATTHIEQEVTDIQARSEEVARAIADIDEVMGSVFELSNTLAAAIEEQNATTREISQSITLSAESTRTVGEEIERIRESATGTDQVARNVLETADQLGELAAALQMAMQAD